MHKTVIKLIVFDMGHVFIDFDWDDVIQGFKLKAAKQTIDFRQIMNFLSNLGYESGKINTPDFINALNKKSGLELDLHEFTQLWNSGFTENSQMAEILTSLKAKFPLYLLSNTNENHFSYLEKVFNVSRHFQELILSYEVGCVKPEIAIYEEVFKRSSLTPHNCLFIDDLPQNINAANDLGMKTILFEGCEKLAQTLTDYEIYI